MSALTELLEAPPRLFRWSVPVYEELAAQGCLPKRAELIRGYIIEKMPKSPAHRALTKRIYDQLTQKLPLGWLVYQEAPLRFLDSEPEPDIAIVQGKEEEFEAHHPTTAALVIEVAVSSVALDRVKAELYAEAGVTEYWIVLSQERAVEIYSNPEPNGYASRRRVEDGELLISTAMPAVKLELSSILPTMGSAI